MGKLKRRKLRGNYTPEEEEIRDSIGEDIAEKTVLIPIDNDIIVSTGCTLLDLAISGGRVHGGGIPGGLMMELFGPPSSGKTALAVDIAASVQHHGGQADFLDPERRLDKEYAKIYGLTLDKKNYSRPMTVAEVFDDIDSWEPKNDTVINAKIIDSVAALCSELELSEGGDKRGQAKAKELHAGCRKTKGMLATDNRLVVFTNHEMDGEYGKTTPGGKAVPYYASLRIRIFQKGLVTLKRKIRSGKQIEQSIGVQSECFIKKSSVDNGYRSAPLYIINGQGIDDIRGNLQWYKSMMKSTKYIAVDKEYQAMNDAIAWIEKNNLEGDLRSLVINLWEEIEQRFKINRKKKVRF